MLNFLLKTIHKKNNYAMFARMGNSTKSMYTYYRQCRQLQGIHKTSVKKACLNTSMYSGKHIFIETNFVF